MHRVELHISAQNGMIMQFFCIYKLVELNRPLTEAVI
jgi:hypothetical protein